MVNSIGIYRVIFRKICNFCIPGLLALLFIATSLINNTTFADSTISSKTFFFSYILFLLVFLFLSSYVNSVNAKNITFSKLDMLLFSSVTFVLFNRYIIQKSDVFSIRIIDLYGLAILYLLLRSLSIKHYIYLWFAISLSGILQFLYGALFILVPSLLGGGTILTGSFMNAAPYAEYLSLCGSTSFAIYQYKDEIAQYLITNDNHKVNFWAKHRSQIIKWLAFTSFVSVLIILPATRSRTACLSLLFSILSLFFIKNNAKFKERLKLNKYKPVFKITTIFLGILFSFWCIYKIYGLNKGSSDGRILIWKISAGIVKEHPLFGVGYDDFRAYYMNAQAAYFHHPRSINDITIADDNYYPFNEILRMVVENGIIYLLFLGVIVYGLWNVTTKPYILYLKHIAICILGSIFLIGLFSYPLEILPIKMILVLTLCVLSKLDQDSYKIDLSRHFKKYQDFSKYMMIFLVTICLFFNIYKINRIKDGYKNWQQGLNQYNSAYYLQSVVFFDKAYPILACSGDFLMNYGKALELADQPEKAKFILERSQRYLNTTTTEIALGNIYKKLKLYGKAESAYLEAENMVPNRFYPEYLLAKLYNDTKQNSKEYAIADKILRKNIKVNSPAITQIKEEMSLVLKERKADTIVNSVKNIILN